MLDAYQKAYSEKVNFESWLNGYYTYNAQIIALANAFSDKNSEAIEYPSYVSIHENNEHASLLSTNEVDKPTSDSDNKYLSQFL